MKKTTSTKPAWVCPLRHLSLPWVQANGNVVMVARALVASVAVELALALVVALAVAVVASVAVLVAVMVTAAAAAECCLWRWC